MSGIYVLALCLSVVFSAHTGISQDQNKGELEFFTWELSDQNEGEPDLLRSEPPDQNEGEPKFLELFEVSPDIGLRRQASDMMKVPDSVWNKEANYARTHPVGTKLGKKFGNDLSPPSTACLSIKIIFNDRWVQSSANGYVTRAVAAARAVLAEAQNIYNSKFAASNRLGTAVTFNLIGDPIHDSTGYWQADNGLDSYDVQRHVDKSTYTTQHYAFLTGRGNGGSIGMAWLSTPCMEAGEDQTYKTSITEWYNNIADTGGVLAHELGHALGMEHDFNDSGGTRYDRQGKSCTDIDGVMDYGEARRVNKFSSCSRQDFRDYYNRMLRIYDGAFCMRCSTNPTQGPGTTPAATTQRPSSCNGVPFADRSCCSYKNQCSDGEGDCDRDSDCQGSLVCGRNNCRNDFSTPGSNWSRSADCCVGQTETTGRCKGGIKNEENKECCNRSNPCNEGEGDCDRNSECKGNLVCGRNNCGPNFWRSADCCEKR